MRLQSLVILPFLVLLLPAQGKTVHASLGPCTRQQEFKQRQQAIDTKVQALASAVDGVGEEVAVAALIAAAERDIECLIRYREPCLVPVFARILTGEQPWFLRARAAYGLRMLDEEGGVPALIVGLGDADSMVREACASALGRFGGDEAKAALKARLEVEEDRYVKATLAAMLSTTDEPPYYRSDEKVWLEDLVGPDGAMRVAFAWTVKGKNLFNDLAARAIEAPVADDWVYPIQRYEEDLFAGYPRNSFGGKKGHAGEDCAWFRDGSGIYAAAAGVVRMVQGAGGDWGFLVAIEHRLPDGRYLTSIYGHCGYDVLVRAGDVVECGQRIAAVGLSCSVENGGYGAHLHFALGDGPFRRPRGMARGDSINLENKNDAGEVVSRTKAKVLRFGYAEKENSHGWPLCTFTFALPDGGERIVPVPEQQAQHELSWFRAYVRNCRGWVNPQEMLPTLVAGKPSK